MDYKKINAPTNTVTHDMNTLCAPVGNVYETVAIIAKRANQIDAEIKKAYSIIVRTNYLSTTRTRKEILETESNPVKII